MGGNDVKKITKIRGDILKIDLRGELDHHMAHQIKDEIDYCIERHGLKKVLFNFKDVTFMDSSGVGMVIGRYKIIEKAGGKIGVINLSEKIKRIFEMSGLFNIIESYNDEKEATEKM